VHPPSYLAFSIIENYQCPPDMVHIGMNPACKLCAIEWMISSCPGLGKEEVLIWKTIETVQTMFGITTAPLSW